MEKRKIVDTSQYRYLLIGQIVSTFGDTVYLVAILWLATEYTNSAAKISLISVFDTIPAVLTGLLSGAIVDRCVKKRVMIISDAARCILVAMFVISYVLKLHNIAIIYILTLLMAVFQSLYNPSQFALLPLLVEKGDLNKANSISTMAVNAVIAFGNSIGGYVVSFIGTVGALVSDCISFIVSIICTNKIVYKENKTIRVGEKQGSWGKDIYDAIIYVTKNHNICLLLLLSMSLNLISGAFYILPVFVKDILQGEATLYGIIEGAGTIGMILGAGFIMRINKPINKVLSVSALLECVCFIGMALCRMSWLIILFRFILGCSNAAYNTAFTTMCQENVKEAYRGRVYTITYMISTISLPIAAFICGNLSDSMSIAYTWLLFGVLAFIMAATICVGLLHKGECDE